MLRAAGLPRSASTDLSVSGNGVDLPDVRPGRSLLLSKGTYDVSAPAVHFDGTTYLPTKSGLATRVKVRPGHTSSLTEVYVRQATTGGLVQLWRQVSAGSPFAVSFSLDRLACASSSFCLAIGGPRGGDFYQSTWNGSAWSTPAATGLADTVVNSLACITARFCIMGTGSVQIAEPASLMFGTGRTGTASRRSVTPRRIRLAVHRLISAWAWLRPARRAPFPSWSDRRQEGGPGSGRPPRPRIGKWTTWRAPQPPSASSDPRGGATTLRPLRVGWSRYGREACGTRSSRLVPTAIGWAASQQLIASCSPPRPQRSSHPAKAMTFTPFGQGQSGTKWWRHRLPVRRTTFTSVESLPLSVLSETAATRRGHWDRMPQRPLRPTSWLGPDPPGPWCRPLTKGVPPDRSPAPPWAFVWRPAPGVPMPIARAPRRGLEIASGPTSPLG